MSAAAALVGIPEGVACVIPLAGCGLQNTHCGVINPHTAC